MTAQTGSKGDLVALVADKNIEAALEGVLAQPERLRIRRISWQIVVHPYRDPGCLSTGHLILTPFRNDFQQALVMFDRQGCGQPEKDARALEQDVEQQLRVSGWSGGAAAAVCIDPELEAWVWSDSPHVDVTLGWESRPLPLRSWLGQRGFASPGTLKPLNPKEALEAVLREVRRPRSSSIYKELATKVSFARCSDAAFLRLRRLLKRWFPPPRHSG